MFPQFLMYSCFAYFPCPPQQFAFIPVPPIQFWNFIPNYSPSGFIQNQVEDQGIIENRDKIKIEANQVQPIISLSSNEAQPLAESQRQSTNKENLKNINQSLISNLLNFLCSSRCKKMIYDLYPELEFKDFEKMRVFIFGIKRQAKNNYMNRKDIFKLWFALRNSPRKPQFYQIIRRVSFFYLENVCYLNILQNLKIKPELKKVYLEYRRKLLMLLKQGCKKW